MLKQYRLDEYGDILTPEDVHDILGIGYNRTYELLKTGALRSFKIGRERKIPKHCLISFIDEMLSDNDFCDT